MCAHTHFFTPYKAAGSVEKKKKGKKKKSISLPQVIKLSLQSQPETSI